MKRVPNLVNRSLLAVLQTAVWQEGILFKKETNLVTRFQKVIIAQPVLLFRREDRDEFSRIELLNQLFRVSA